MDGVENNLKVKKKGPQVICGSAPVAPATVAFFESIGVNLLNLYGMSENAAFSHTNTPDGKKAGTVGRPLSGGQARLAAGTGEIEVKSRAVMLGYLHDGPKTAATFTADGWLQTGDLGADAGDGFHAIVGRTKEILVTAGGKNVAPVKHARSSPVTSQGTVPCLM